MTSTLHRKQGWLLAAGSALALIGLAIEPSAKQGGGTTTPPQTQTQTQPMGLAGYATADSNNRMIAVTGIDITGASILYLIDTVNPHLAVYQASGGSGSSQGVRLVGARNIALDLQLDGLNDKSEYKYKDLEEQFADLPPANPPR
ncbi:MAG: hypothetical protein H6831_13400 [Planctomycetes bacterium]|nr:hypothetical protein [Planctomycetota bacterium]MCB9905395.1 hypothetical protein [Planctomycetota bacterium]